MDAVGEPDDQRRAADDALALGRAQGRRVGEAEEVLADLLQPLQVLRRGDGDELQRAPLVGAAVLPHLHPRRGRVQGFEIGDDPVPGGEPGAQRIAEERLRTGQALVERRQVERLAARQRRAGP